MEIFNFRDEENDWVELAGGNRDLGPGGRHNSRYPIPIWGTDYSRSDLKGNLFCCLEENG